MVSDRVDLSNRFLDAPRPWYNVRMSWKSLLLGSVTLALMLEATACGLYTSGIGPEGAGGSGGAASSSAQSGSSASSGSGTSSSSGSGPEDCFNDKDDDGNTQTDCLDPACSGVAQCADVPAGWTVIRATQVGDASQPPGICADGKTPQQVYFTLPAGMPTCSACGCAPNVAAQCSAPQISCWEVNNNTTCAGSPNYIKTENTTGCFAIGGIPQGTFDGSCRLTGPPTLLNQQCDITGAVMAPAPMWGGAVFTCDAPSSTGGCMSGQRCVPTGMPPDSQVCIKKDGTAGCPGGWTTAISAFTSGKDNRSCDSCNCMLGCTGGSYLVHDFSNCGDNQGGGPHLVNSNSCVPMPATFSSSTASLDPTPAATSVTSCTGGTPHGQVDPDPMSQVQICCK
jgi:hypothetical protein